MTNFGRWALALLLTAWAGQAHPLDMPSSAPWAERAAELALAKDPEWLALGHYARTFGGGFRSYADDGRFFLGEGGDRDPAAELEATLESFFSDAATQCRFPARRSWLARRLPGLATALPAATCAKYQEWRGILNADRVVLVFAASYLNSPSSMYGHTFLRFDPAEVDQRTPLLSYALNFGAAVPEEDNDLLYAYRGLAGGYPGRFAAGPYFEKLREYSRLENRDLWEYSLNLTAAEVDRLVEHVWELREIVFDYYFFDENCSMRLLELLDVARPGHDLASLFPHYAIPVDTVRAVRDAGMVAEVDYRPANLTVLEARIATLTPAERRLALAISAEPALSTAAEFQSLDASRQRMVAEVAYGVHRHSASGRKVDPAARERNLALLQLMNAPPSAGAAEITLPVRPDDGHETMLISASAGTEAGKAIGDAEWRLSYHDLLDDRAGHPEDASLNMGRFVVRAREGGELQVQQVDVIEITSLAPRDDFVKPLSWRVNFGWDRQWTDGDDPLVTQVNGGVGWTATLLGDLNVSGLVTARLEHNTHKSGELDLAPGFAALASLGSRWGETQLGIEGYHFLDGTERSFLNFGHNLPLGRNLALRIHLERQHSGADRVFESTLALRYYF